MAGDIAKDSVKLFALTRNTQEGDTPISRWQFQFGYPYYPPGVTRHGPNSVNKVFARTGGGGHARVHWKADIALRYYQLHIGYTPGPVFLFGLLAGLAGIFTFRRGAATPGPRWPACSSPDRRWPCCWARTCTSSPGATSCPR